MLQQVRIINGQKVLVPLSGSTPTNEVTSGNMNPVTSNAVANILNGITEFQCGSYTFTMLPNRTSESDFIYFPKEFVNTPKVFCIINDAISSNEAIVTCCNTLENRVVSKTRFKLRGQSFYSSTQNVKCVWFAIA